MLFSAKAWIARYRGPGIISGCARHVLDGAFRKGRAGSAEWHPRQAPRGLPISAARPRRDS